MKTIDIEFNPYVVVIIDVVQVIIGCCR